jgi:hypothetical protein
MYQAYSKSQPFLKSIQLNFKIHSTARCRWLTPVILATQEAEIRRNEVQSQPGQTVHKTLSQKDPFPKRAGGVAQG